MTQLNPAIIHKGKIYAYRIFDIGGEVNLSVAASILEKKESVSRYYLRKTHRSLIISERPMVITLAPQNFAINNKMYGVGVSAKLWSFGSISLQMTFSLEDSHSLEQLGEIGYFIENNPEFHHFAFKNMKHLVEFVSPAIAGHEVWSDYEDYLIYNIEQADGIDLAHPESLLRDDITSLIFAEKPTAFAQSVNDSMSKHILQYGKDDLVMIHWNGAIICDPEDGEDVADIIEFAVCQLLELRFYDQLLDKQLATLYQNIDNKKASMWRNPYAHLSTQAALQYIELSEIIDKIGNAFKTTGDFYYATIFRAATQKFYIQDWRLSVSNKLNNLAEVSKLFQGEVNERRNQFMEATIIALITIEVAPFVYDLIKSFFN